MLAGAAALAGWALGQARALERRLRRPGMPEPRPVADRERVAQATLQGARGYYCLGAGGRDPSAPTPWGDYVPARGELPEVTRRRRALGRVWCDCSGGIAHVLGVPRRIAGYAGGWEYVSTDGLVADANDPAVELVEWASRGAPVLPWQQLVVYGSLDRDGDGRRDAIGHVGVVVGARVASWRYEGAASLEQLDVWHVAASSAPTGACRVSSGAPWARRGRLLQVL